MDADLSLDELAEKVTKVLKREVSKAMLSQYQTGQSPPKFDTLEAYAKVCHVDPGWLAFGASSRAPEPGSPDLRPGQTYVPDRQAQSTSKAGAKTTPKGALSLSGRRSRRTANGGGSP